MSRIEQLSDRHNRTVHGLGDADSRGIAVRLIANDLSSKANQHVLVCLTNLLCRLTGSVSSVFVVAEDHDINVVLPHRPSGCKAMDAIMSMSAWANGGAIPFIADAETPADFTVAINSSEDLTGVGINVAGCGWIAWVGSKLSPTFKQLSDDPNPIGPYFAACMAAGEVFKFSRGLKKGRFARDDAYSVWNGRTGCIAELPQGPSITGALIPAFLLVGAGAVGQGLLLALGAIEPAKAFVVTIDFDSHEASNLNRCFVAGADDENHFKVEAVTRFRETSDLNGFEFSRSLSEFVASPPTAHLPPDLAAAISNDHFPLIISAVDRNDSRWDIQGLQPDIVLGGSTINLTANAATYTRGIGRCLACYNPPEEDASRFRELSEQLRAMDETERRAFLVGKVQPTEIASILEYFASETRCGTLGEKALKNFAASGTREFSVSFVSMAAAVMLLGRLLQSQWLETQAPIRDQYSSFNFRNLDGSDENLCREPGCPHCQPASCRTD